LASRYGTLLFTLIQVAPIATIMFGQKPQTALKCDNMLFGRVHMVGICRVHGIRAVIPPE
jgi:hypothetical protein